MEDSAGKGTGSLRVAVCLDALSAPLWMCDMLTKIKRIPGVEIVLLFLTETGQEASRKIGPWTGAVRSLVRHRGQETYRIWNSIDRAVFKVSPNAFRDVDCDELFSGCGRICVKSGGTEEGMNLSVAEVDAIRRSQPDVILQLA